jgi:hypothetical protein
MLLYMYNAILLLSIKHLPVDVCSSDALGLNCNQTDSYSLKKPISVNMVMRDTFSIHINITW